MRAVAEGASCRAAAARFGVSASSAIRWCARLRETGSVVPGALGGDRRSGRIEAHAPQILAAGGAHARPHARGAAGRFWPGPVSPSAWQRLWRFLDRHRDHAQKKTAHAAEQNRPDVLKRRWDWFEGQLDLEPERLVFIDETWASTKSGLADSLWS